PDVIAIFADSAAANRVWRRSRLAPTSAPVAKGEQRRGRPKAPRWQGSLPKEKFCKRLERARRDSMPERIYAPAASPIAARSSSIVHGLRTAATAPVDSCAAASTPDG